MQVSLVLKREYVIWSPLALISVTAVWANFLVEIAVGHGFISMYTLLSGLTLVCLICKAIMLRGDRLCKRQYG